MFKSFTFFHVSYSIKSFRKMTIHDKRQSFIHICPLLEGGLFELQWKFNSNNVCHFEQQSRTSISMATVAKASHSTAKSLGCQKIIKVFKDFLILLSYRKPMYNMLYWTRIQSKLDPSIIPGCQCSETQVCICSSTHSTAKPQNYTEWVHFSSIQFQIMVVSVH